MIAHADRLEADEAQVDATASDPDANPNPAEAPPKKRGGGPKTEAGKASSRWNAYQHGMRAKVLMPEEMAAAVAERKDDLTQEFAPDTPYQEWLLGEMALASIRLDRLATLSMADMQRTIDRAELSWDKDRWVAAEDLGARLPRQPSRVKRALEATKHGASWLEERWRGLGAALEAKSCWDDAQRAMAFDLLGVPQALRDGVDRVPQATDAVGLAALVASELARLREEREGSLEELDLGDRALAASGLGMAEDAETARLRKYEGTCRRALHWALAELRRVRVACLPGGGPSSSGPGDIPRSSLSKAALEFMAERAEAFERAKFEVAVGRAAEDEGFELDVDEFEAAVVAPPAPARAFTSASKSPAPRNRRERRAQERRARQA